MSRVRVAAAAVALAALLAAACSDGRGASAPGTTRPATRGGVLRIGLEAPRSLDPVDVHSTSEAVLADLQFDGLTARPGGSDEARAALADHWSATDDLRQWDFHVRTGRRFSNGRPVTAAAAVASLRRVAATPATGVAGPLAGADVAEADGGVRVRFAEPVADVAELLAHPAFGIAPEGASFTGDRVVGSGPFALASRAGDQLVLRRSPGGRALLDEVDVRTGELGTLARLVPDELDWSLVLPGPAPARAGQGSSPVLATLFYGFNVRAAPFDDARVREAAVRAVARGDVVRSVYGDGMVAVDGPLPLQVPGAGEEACGDRCRHDVDAARTLLRQAFPAGTPAPKVAIDVEDETAQVAVAHAIEADLRAVGFDSSVRPHPAADYPAFLGSGQAQLFRFGWVATWPSPAAFLPGLFRSGAPTNVMGYASPAVDDAMRVAAATASTVARRDAWAAVERRIMADVPVLPIGQFQSRAVRSPAVHGLRRDLFGSFDGATVSVTR